MDKNSKIHIADHDGLVGSAFFRKLKDEDYNNLIYKNYKELDLRLECDPKYFRPTEVELLIGDPTKAKEKLGWEPKVKFEELVEIMVKADIDKLAKDGEVGLDYLE